MNEANSIFSKTEEFVAHLRVLREKRLLSKLLEKDVRAKLTPKQRIKVLERTNGRCHICGGEILAEWVADHVHAHTYGGGSSLENYLPAHRICNQYKWFYGAEEFQWILKMGVYFRTQLEEEGSPSAMALAHGFMAHEKRRNSRRKGARTEKPSVIDADQQGGAAWPNKGA